MHEQETWKEEGFTLIELLVVIIIIGTLAAIAIPVFLNQRKKGYDAQVRSDIHNAAAQLETYGVDYAGALPNDYSLTADTLMTVTTDGFTVGKSANDQSLVVRLTPGTGSTTTVGYLIAGYSLSGRGFCYSSVNSNKGVYANPTTATLGSTSGC